MSEKNEFVRVLNLHADVVSNGYVDGYNCDFGPQGSSEGHKDLPRFIAEQLIEQWPNYLFIAGEGKTVEVGQAEVRESGDYRYIANITGDPDEPEFLQVALNTDKTGKVTPSKEKNMRREPRIIKEYLGGGHVTWKSPQDGTLNQKTLPKTLYTIFPMQRIKVSKKIADAMLYKDRYNMPWVRGSIVLSRPEQPGEPKMSWKLDELRHYGLLLLGDIRGAGAFKETEADVHKRLTDEGLLPEDDEYKAKMMSVKAAYHNKLMKRVLDASVKIPTQAQFQAYMKRVQDKEERAKKVANAK